VLVSIYLGLGTKEPAFYLQVLIYASLFVYMAFYLQRMQRRSKDRQIAKEKLAEDLHLTRQEIRKKADLKRAIQAKIDRFLDLQRFSEELKGASSLEEVASHVVREAHEVLADKADECLLYIVNEAEQTLSLAARVPPVSERTPEISGRIFDQWVMKRSQAVIVDDTRDDFRFTSEDKPDLDDWRSVCASPLVVENKVLGVIRANSRSARSFAADDLRLLDIFASVGAVNLRNILLFATMQELATRDSLTGLAVNRTFQERLAAAAKEHALGREAFSIVLLDIDHFKRYNDDYGHSAGDLVLKSIGTVLSQHAGPRDLAARYGGEEFVLLLEGKGKKDALAAAERLRAEIEKSALVIRRMERRVTASLGVATFPEDGRSAEDLIRKADKRLYEAKRAGRNQVCGAT
jgi:diguanylate cyclase (GGDEF)-like protein